MHRIELVLLYLRCSRFQMQIRQIIYKLATCKYIIRIFCPRTLHAAHNRNNVSDGQLGLGECMSDSYTNKLICNSYCIYMTDM